MRNAELILYFFYKNMVFTLPQFMFAYINGYSGQTIYDDYYITCYNMVFTALPLAAKAIYDQDVSPNESNLDVKPLLPKLYYVGQKSTIFNWTNYFVWVFTGVVHSLIIFILPYYIFLGTISRGDGQTSDLWIFSITSFTSIIFIVNLKLMVQMKYFTRQNFVAIIVLSIGIYYAFMWVCNYLTASNTYATILEMHLSPLYYLAIGLCVALCFCVDLFIRAFFFNVLTTPVDFLRRLVRQKLSVEAL